MGEETAKASADDLDAQRDGFAARFGAHLTSAGLLDAAGFERARRATEATRDRFDRVLTKLGLVAEQDLAPQLARFLGLPLHDEAEAPTEPVVLAEVDRAFLESRRIVPLALDAGTLTVATVDPLDREALSALAYLVDREIRPRVISPMDYERLMASLRVDAEAASPEIDIDARTEVADERDLQRLRELASEAPVIRLVSQIVAKAVEAGASDIHFEPRHEATLVRYRIDGALRVAQTIPAGLQAAVASRVKIMAKLDIAERRLPQDGRIKLAVRGVDVDFRVSTLPTIFGESIVMRILDRRAVKLDFAELGFEAPMIARLRHLMAEPNGIVLVTGPTGSGKTTTLYTALKEINRPDVKLFTVEDPIEFQLSGVNQVQVQPTIGLDFPSALRSILRQDPDAVMIGEIRDVETARIAIQASLTGHLVLSTLHTNSAAASVTRLIDMGLESYLLASTLKGVLAQRLVRRLCPHCSVPQADASEWHDRVPETARSGPPNFRVAQGCDRCGGVGYRGRSTISELLIVDRHVQRLIHTAAADVEIERIARTAGMRLLHEDGLAKAWRGETSVAEVFSVARGD